MSRLKNVKIGSIVLSLTMIGLGAVIMIRPEFSVVTLCYLLGAVILITGIVKIIRYFTHDLFDLAFQFDLALGILGIVFGAVLLLHPAILMQVLPVALGIFILAESAFTFQTAHEARRFGLEQWWLILLAGILSGIFALLLIAAPFEAASALMSIFGASLLVFGVQGLVVDLTAIRYPKQ
ncbi:MAG TPA: DUF308 domain-containing protein [Oscillospiraceae bacterium]|nr:DUF308 domain-containing protein [Oscillospiraceae bacterium]